MKPLFFPYTYVMEPTIKDYRCFFSGISVLQSSMKHMPELMGQWAAQGLLEVQLPDPAVCRVFDKVLAETENWARNHRGGVASFIKGYQDDVPFFGPSSVSQIRQDIRTAGRAASPDTRQQESLLRARIFLQIAQDFDAHNQWLSQQLQQQEVMQRNLYRELRGDEHSTGSLTEPVPPRENQDLFEYMILDRMKAWSRVVLSHGHVKGPLVTTTASVLNLIQEQISDSEKPILVATIPAIREDALTANNERQALMEYCQKLLHSPMPLINDSGLLDVYPAETTDTLSMKLYLLPDIAPQRFLARFVEGELPGDRDAADEVNTLIGFIHSIRTDALRTSADQGNEA